MRRALLTLAFLVSGCTAVYGDFEECSVEPPRTFDSPPCGMDYNDCLRGCGTDEGCADRCATDRPDCDQCFTDTYRICSQEVAGCEATYTDLICCVEGSCSAVEGLCDDCRPINDALTTCFEAAAGTCRPRLNECLQVPLMP